MSLCEEGKRGCHSTPVDIHLNTEMRQARIPKLKSALELDPSVQTQDKHDEKCLVK